MAFQRLFGHGILYIYLLRAFPLSVSDLVPFISLCAIFGGPMKGYCRQKINYFFHFRTWTIFSQEMRHLASLAVTFFRSHFRISYSIALKFIGHVVLGHTIT